MGRLCSQCAHDGQCVGLPYCGGLHYEPNLGDKDGDEENDEEEESEGDE